MKENYCCNLCYSYQNLPFNVYEDLKHGCSSFSCVRTEWFVTPLRIDQLLREFCFNHTYFSLQNEETNRERIMTEKSNDVTSTRIYCGSSVVLLRGCRHGKVTTCTNLNTELCLTDPVHTRSRLINF